MWLASREPEARTKSAAGHEPGPASEYSPLSFPLNLQWRIECRLTLP